MAIGLGEEWLLALNKCLRVKVGIENVLARLKNSDVNVNVILNKYMLTMRTNVGRVVPGSQNLDEEKIQLQTRREALFNFL